MHKYKIIFILFMTAFLGSAVYGQDKPEGHLIKSVTGIVISEDAVGNVINIRTENDQRQMAFFVPDKAIITQETHPIGLMDIGDANSVTIQYYLSSAAKNTVVSIVDNESVVNE